MLHFHSVLLGLNAMCFFQTVLFYCRCFCQYCNCSHLQSNYRENIGNPDISLMSLGHSVGCGFFAQHATAILTPVKSVYKRLCGSCWPKNDKWLMECVTFTDAPVRGGGGAVQHLLLCHCSGVSDRDKVYNQSFPARFVPELGYSLTGHYNL